MGSLIRDDDERPATGPSSLLTGALRSYIEDKDDGRLATGPLSLLAGALRSLIGDDNERLLRGPYDF